LKVVFVAQLQLNVAGIVRKDLFLPESIIASELALLRGSGRGEPFVSFSHSLLYNY
jgi:hypothetical protein